MRTKCGCLVLSCLLNFSSYAYAENRQIKLIHNFTKEPTSQDIFLDANSFFPMKSFLEKQDISITCSDMKEYPFFHKPTFLTKFFDSCLKLIGQDAHTQFTNDTTSSFVFWNIPQYISKTQLKKVHSQKFILFAWEPPTVHPSLYRKRYEGCFSKIYTWNDDLVDNKKFFKFFYPVHVPMQENLPAFKERKLCTLLGTNRTSKHPYALYDERKKVVGFFETKDAADFDFYGRGWTDQPYKHYKGSVEDKYATLKSYRFSICYENMTHIKGYITEKIFDCFAVGNIPVYLGATNIEDYIPKNCFIDRRDFSSDEQLYAFMESMSEETYNDYVSHIAQFLQSEQALLFSKEHFVKTFYEAVK